MIISQLPMAALVTRPTVTAVKNDGDSLVDKPRKHNHKNSIVTDQRQIYFLAINRGFNFKSSSYLKTLLTQT